MLPLRELALPEVSGTTYTYTFPAISQGLAASVTVSVPGAPPTASWTVYAGSLPVASLTGANAITGLYLSGGEQCSIVGTSPTAPGPAVEVGQLGSLSEVPVTVPTVTPGATTIAGTVDATIQNATIDVSGSTVVLGPGPVSYVAIPNPSAGSDWAYTLPSELRLVACRAVLTTSATVAQRIPYLWQVVSGDTLPTAEVLFSPHAVPGGTAVVLNGVPNGAPATGATPRIVADGGLTTTLTPIYSVPGGGSFEDGQLSLANTSGASVAVVVHTTDGTVLFQDNAVASGSTVTVPVPGLQAGDTISALANADSAISYVLSGREVAGAHYVVSFSGLLIPAGGFVGTATGNLQAGDQWSGIQLAFTEH